MGQSMSTVLLNWLWKKRFRWTELTRICVTYDMNNNDIRISEAEGDMLTVKEYNTEELAEDEISTVEVDGSRLEVKGRKETELIMCILGRIMTSIWAIIQNWSALLLQRRAGVFDFER